MRIRLINITTDEVIAEEVHTAYRFWPRLKGLIGTADMPDKTALHIAPCRSIHTYFMNYSLDILYLSKQNEIVGIEENLQPGRMGKRFPGVHTVIELPAGRLQTISTVVGDTVAFVAHDQEQTGTETKQLI